MVRVKTTFKLIRSGNSSCAAGIEIVKEKLVLISEKTLDASLKHFNCFQELFLSFKLYLVGSNTL